MSDREFKVGDMVEVRHDDRGYVGKGRIIRLGSGLGVGRVCVEYTNHGWFQPYQLTHHTPPKIAMRGYKVSEGDDAHIEWESADIVRAEDAADQLTSIEPIPEEPIPEV